MRRFFKYSILLILLLAALLIAGLIVFIETERFDRWATQQMIRFLEDRFEARVEIGKVDVRLLQTEVEIWNFRLFNRRYPSEEPAIGIDHLLFDFSILSFFTPSVSLDELFLDSPVFRLLQDPNDRLNFANVFDPPRPEQRQPERPPDEKRDGFSFVGLGVKRFDIRDGLFIYQREPFHIESARGGMDTHLRFYPQEEKYAGRTSFDELDVTINGFGLNDLHALIDFEYFENAVRLQAVRLESPGFEADVQGAITDLRNFVYRFENRVSIDLPTLERPDLRPHFQEGRITAEGIFAGSRGDFRFDGDVRSDFLRFQGLPFSDVQARISATRDVLTVDRVTTTFFQGRSTAQGVLRWQEESESNFQVSASGVGIHPLLHHFNREWIRAHGRGDFKGNVRWPGLKWKQMRGQGQLAYLGNFSAQGLVAASTLPPLPFEGTAAVSFVPGTVNLSNGILRTLENSVQYAGVVTFEGQYRFDFSLESDRSQELLLLAGHSGVPERFVEEEFIRIDGPTTISGTFQNPADQFDLHGTLQTAEVFLKDEFLGDFRTEFVFDGSDLQLENGVLEGPRYRLRASVGLATAERGLALLDTLELRLNRVPLQTFLALIEQPLPVQGEISGGIEVVQEDSDQFKGTGELTIADFSAYGEHLDRLAGRLEVQNQSVRVTNLEGRLREGTLSGQASFDLSDWTYSVELQGQRFPLESVQALQERVQAQGNVQFSLAGKGSFARPQFRLSLESPRIRVRDQVLSDFQVRIASRADTLDVLARYDWMDNPFRLSGQAQLAEPYSMKGVLQMDQTPIGPYLQLLPLPNLPQIEGTVSGRIDIDGRWREPSDLRIRADLPRLNLSMADYDLTNMEPVRMNYRNETLTIESSRFQGSQTEFRMGGTISLTGERSVNLHTQGAVNLLILNSFLPVGRTAGQLELETVIAGTLDRPRIVGTARLENGFLTHPDSPTPLFDARGNLKFTANQVSLENLTARTTYGTIALDGGIFLEGLKPTRWQVNIFANGLRWEYPQDTVALLDVDVDLLKSETSQLLSGSVNVRAWDYTRNISIAQLILQQAEAGMAPQTPEAAEEMTLDLSVEAQQSLRIDNNLADAIASAELDIRGTVQSPVILGTVTMNEGTLFLENNRYEIVRGTVNFTNPRRTHAVLNFEAETEIREHTIAIILQGPIDQLRFSFRADPPLPTPSIVSLLAVGQTQEEIFGARGEAPGQLGTMAAFGAGTLLSKSLGEQLEARTSRLFGFEKFSIDPFLFGRERDPGARITLGEQLTENLSITYSTALGSSQQAQIVVIEYRVTDWLTAVGTREQDGSIAVDFRLKTRF